MLQQRIALLIAVAALGFLAPANAQLSGIYTVDGSTATGGSNFQTLQEAADACVAMGISGPVEFIVVQNGTVPYAGFSMGQVPGSSSVNTIKFGGLPGLPALIGSSAASFTQGIRLGTNTTASTTAVSTGPSYVTIEGFTVENIASSTGIMALGCDFVTIRNCLVRNCGSGIGLSVTNDSVIENCEVEGTTHVPGTGGSASYSGGISVYYLSARNTVRANRVHDCTDNGIFVGSSGSTTATPDNVIINNFVWNVGTQTSSTYAGGIALRRATNAVVANNTIVMDPASQWAALRIMGGSSTAPLIPMEISNNIFSHPGGFALVQTEYTGQYGPLFDYNLYDTTSGAPFGGFGTGTPATATTFNTLPAWQGETLQSANAVEGAPGFLGATDLHITPASPAFNAGSSVATVNVDIDGDTRPLGGIPDIGADETQAVGLFASFTSDVTSGPAALTVNFTDQTFTTDPGGVLTWTWDLDGDTVPDAFTQNPSFTYNCPGTYSVSLTVTDASNPSSTLTRTGLITVTDYVFSISTTGALDLTVLPVPPSCYPSAVQGYTLVSLTTGLGAPGNGPFLGIWPDTLTISGISFPLAVGNPFHFAVSPVAYPEVPLILPPGAMVAFSGLTMDAVQVLLDGGGNLVYVSNVSRATF